MLASCIFHRRGDGAISDGFGLYRTNLLTLITPVTWSYLLKDLPGALGDGEGYGFLGLGLLFLAICALVGWLQGNTGFGAALRKRPLLLLALACLGIFSLSNHIAIGSLEFTYPLPAVVIKIANIFRASGRMFWPVYYAVILTIIFLVIRANRPRTATYLLTIALLLQVMDTHSGWSIIRKRLMVEPASEWATPFVDPFWKSAVSHYRKVRWVVPQNLSPAWMHVAAFAGKYGLSTDAVYLGRMDLKQWGQADQKASRAFATGQYDADSLYLLDNRALLQAVATVNTQTDLFARIDGFTVLAPGWKQCADCPQLIAQVPPTDFLPTIEPGQKNCSIWVVMERCCWPTAGPILNSGAPGLRGPLPKWCFECPHPRARCDLKPWRFYLPAMLGKVPLSASTAYQH
uniref:DUF6311 domain-containing protein n=1 Tax=Pseudomonas sp. TH31 TaxID=2796396 RepID=UPI00313AD0A5